MRQFTNNKRILFFLITLLICFGLLTPTNVFDFTKKLLNKILPEVSFLQGNKFNYEKMIYTYFDKLIIVLINFLLIPIFIDFQADFENFRRKSSR